MFVPLTVTLDTARELAALRTLIALARRQLTDADLNDPDKADVWVLSCQLRVAVKAAEQGCKSSGPIRLPNDSTG